MKTNNPSQKTITRLSVHAFIEAALPCGDLFAAAPSYGQLQEGSRVHRQVQKESGPDTQAEVPVLYCREGLYTALEIGGRMDGWRADENGPTVIEIKTTRQDPDSLSEGLDAHWNQARVYGAIRCLQEGYARMGVELLYVGLPGGDIKRLRREYDAPELTGWFLDACDRLLAAADAEFRRLGGRDRALEALTFPFGEFRPGQREMAARVYRTARDSGTCLLEAPTGIGKTMAALFPALKALGQGHGDRIFYLTARTTVKGIAEEALSRIHRPELPLRSVTLTAKEKICPLPGTPCHPAFCPRAAGFYDRLPSALAEADGRWGHFGREAVAELAERHGLCPFELSLCLAQRCDVVVCDYNYVFDPRVYLRRFFDEPGQGVLLIDEAHNLVDRARDMFSAELNRHTALALEKALAHPQTDREKALRQAAGKLSRVLLSLCQALAEDQSETLFDEPPQAVTEAARKLMQAAEPLLGAPGREGFAEPMINLYFECRTYSLTAEGFDSSFAAYLTGGKARARLRIYCVDPASRLAERYEKVRAAALFSASLTPFDYFRRLLGLRDAASLSLPTPFPAENLCVLIEPGASTAFRQRDESLPRVVEALHRLITGRPGHYLAFFPSYRYMTRVHDLFESQYPRAATLVQQPGMDEPQREAFLRRFDADGRPLLGFAVMGGIFGEGVDLTGDRLIGAAIVGVGLPQLCLERNLIRRYHCEQGEDGYAFAYSLPGLIRVIQAAGRVIRSADDRGVVLLIDPRFMNWDLRELLPGWWGSPEPVESGGELSRRLRDFWES